MKLSVVIPCYNEEKIIRSTYARLMGVMEDNELDYELIFVNDGSRDNTLGYIMEFAQDDENCKYISFSRNFGKEAAMLAGLSYSSGDAVVIIDADLQHPPELIPEMIAEYEKGYDQVIARRTRKGDASVKTFFARTYYKIVNKLVDVKLSDGVGDFRLLSRKAVNTIISMPEYNRFSKGLFSWIGFAEKQIRYENISRDAGESKWRFKDLLQYGIEGILSFNNKPLRLVISFGGIMIALSIIYILYMLIRIIMVGIDAPGYFTTISAVMILGGVQLISLGVIGEYVGRIYYEVKRRPHYIIDHTNIEQSDKTERT
ncbi:MAG TPA: glycosyltransferase family 2 protein [Clostridia bacterium]|nr:glycosyltransferase family 2 protein [Clostridia bacterium]